MQKNQPLVTVITVCYNHARFVVECLESIRQQTYHHTQLIIIDDCSQDGSVEIIRDWIDRHQVECTFIAHERNRGLCPTLNEALRLAKGKYISLIATDDVWMFNKTELQVELMEQLPQSVGVVYADALQIDEQGNLLPKTFHEAHLNVFPYPEGDLLATLIRHNFIPAMATLIRRSCYEKVGLYDERLCYEDWDMWFRISQYFQFAFSPNIAAKYRIVSTSLTRTTHHKPTPRFHESNFWIYAKFLDSPRCSQEYEQYAKDRMLSEVESLYKLRAKTRHKYIGHMLRYQPRLYMLGMLAFSLLGKSYQSFVAFYENFERLRHRIEGRA